MKLIPLMFNAAFPVLFTVTACAALVAPTVWLVKVKFVRLRLTDGPLPVPAKVTTCWLPVTLLVLSVMDSEAARFPETVGVNVTLIVQVVLAPSELPHVVVSAKSPGLAPVSEMLLMVRARFPLLFTVIFWAVLDEPTF